MKRLERPLTALAALMLLPATSVFAQDLSYTYVELDYIIQDVDLFEDDEAFDQILEDIDDGDGWKVEGSYAFPNNVFVFGNYSSASAEFTFINDTGTRIPEDEDVKVMSLGIGYFHTLPQQVNNMRIDIFGRAAYQDVDYGDFAFGSDPTDIDDFDDVDDAFDDLNEDNSDGYYLDLGARAQVVQWMEAAGGVRYTDLDTGDDFSFFLSALFEINQNMGINLAGNFGDQVRVYELGFRYSL